jgi:hypothetical protein
MELIIVLAIVGVIIAFLVMQRRKELSADQKPAEVVAEMPYKLETPTAEPAPVVEPTLVVETPVQVVEEASVSVAEAPAVKEKKPRKPRAPKVVQSAMGEEPVKPKRKPRSKKA